MSDISLNLINMQLTQDGVSKLDTVRPKLSDDELGNVSQILKDADKDGRGLSVDEFKAAVNEMRSQDMSPVADFLEEKNQAWLKGSADARSGIDPNAVAPEQHIRENLAKLGVKKNGEYVVSDSEIFNIKSHMRVDLGLGGMTNDIKIHSDHGSAIDEEGRVKFSHEGKEYSAKLDDNGKFVDMKSVNSEGEGPADIGSMSYKLTHIDSNSFKLTNKTSGPLHGVTQANGSFTSGGEKLNFSYTDNDLRITDSSGKVSKFTDNDIRNNKDFEDFSIKLFQTRADREERLR